MGVFDWLFKKKKRIVINYNAEDLSEGEKFQSVLNENAYLKGQLARIKSDESKKRESDKDKEEEKKTIQELNLQKIEIDSERVNPVSLFEILKYIQRSRKKPRKFPPIHFTTFDGSSILGKVDDFTLMPDGGFGCVSNGKIIWASKEISNVFFWIGGLNNFAKKKIIPLCVNSKGEFNPNVQAEEISDLIIDSDGKFKILPYNKKPLYELIAEKNTLNQELHSELEMKDATIAGQQGELNITLREANLHKNRADVSSTRLSDALNKVAEIEMANGMMARQVVSLTKTKEINEDLIDSLEKVIKEWGEKIEQKFGGDAGYNAWKDLREKLEWAKTNMPQTIYQMPEKEEKPTLTEQFKPVKV